MNSGASRYYMELVVLAVFSLLAAIILVGLYLLDVSTGYVPGELFLFFSFICVLIAVGAGIASRVYKSSLR